MKRYILAYTAALAAFLAFDLVWLGLVANSFYREAFAAAGFPVEIDFAVALGFYALHVVGVTIFAVAPALERADWRRAPALGGLFGLFTYATYDLTNLATLQGWPLSVALVDIPWGVVVSAVAAGVGYVAGVAPKRG